jgi:hypothetical protein
MYLREENEERGERTFHVLLLRQINQRRKKQEKRT